MATHVELPDFPASSEQLEDYVAALFQASRYFVEKNVVERDPTDVLELDAVATSYEESPPSSVLVEAKSGDWGFGEELYRLHANALGWLDEDDRRPVGVDPNGKRTRAGRLISVLRLSESFAIGRRGHFVICAILHRS